MADASITLKLTPDEFATLKSALTEYRLVLDERYYRSSSGSAEQFQIVNERIVPIDELIKAF